MFYDKIKSFVFPLEFFVGNDSPIVETFRFAEY